MCHASKMSALAHDRRTTALLEVVDQGVQVPELEICGYRFVADAQRNAFLEAPGELLTLWFL